MKEALFPVAVCEDIYTTTNYWTEDAVTT